MSKVVIVTGASRGIGLAVARHLHAHQHRLVLVARSEAPLAALQAQFPQHVAFAAADAADYAAPARVVALAVATFGRLDGIVINHGALLPIARIADVDVAAWKQLYDVNVFSALAFAQAAIPQLRASRGRIVLTSSGAATKAYVSWAAYGSSKAAANALIAHLALEEPAIVSVAVQPGRVDTDMQADIRKQGSAAMADKDYTNFVQAFEDGGLHPPEKPAEVIAKLALDATPDLSGKFVSWAGEDMAPYHWQ